MKQPEDADRNHQHARQSQNLDHRGECGGKAVMRARHEGIEHARECQTDCRRELQSVSDSLSHRMSHSFENGYHHSAVMRAASLPRRRRREKAVEARDAARLPKITRQTSEPVTSSCMSTSNPARQREEQPEVHRSRTHAVDGCWTGDGWALLEGRNINGPRAFGLVVL